MQVDIGVLDTTVSSNSSRDSSFPYLNQRPHHPVVKAIPADPVKSRCCLPPGRQRFVLILTLVALSALLAGGVFASVVIFEFSKFISKVAIFRYIALWFDPTDFQLLHPVNFSEENP